MSRTNIAGYLIDIGKMKGSTCGKIGVAENDGTKYFCKMFNDPVEPDENSAMGEATRKKNQARFDAFVERKYKINSTLREICGRGGNIIFPVEEVIHDNHWTEFSEYVEGAVPDDKYAEVIGTLSPAEKVLVIKIAMGALQTIHSQKIVHGDLKLPNVMLVKNSRGHYVSKIIDFDGAFFEGDVPDMIIGTPDYYSPELAIYSSLEESEDRRKMSKYMTVKSDIFSMGLILHEYLSGEKPAPDFLSESLQKLKDSGKFIYPWQVVMAKANDGKKPQLVISDKITDPIVVSLISDMLQADPDDRPSAAEVISRLNSGMLPVDTEPWAEDRIVFNIAGVNRELVGLKRIEKTTDDREQRKYEIVRSDGRRYALTAKELVNQGLASWKEVFDDTRPEDDIAWNKDVLKKLFVSAALGEKKGLYLLTDRKGQKRLMSVKQLLMSGLARRKVSPEKAVKEDRGSEFSVKDTGTKTGKKIADELTYESGLWPEDEGLYEPGTEINEKYRLKLMGRSTMNGVKGYCIGMGDNRMQFWPVQKCRMMKVLVPKSS